MMLCVFSYVSAFMQWESSLMQESASYDLAHGDFHLCLYDSEAKNGFYLIEWLFKKNLKTLIFYDTWKFKFLKKENSSFYVHK